MPELLTHDKRFIGPFTFRESIYVAISLMIVFYLYLLSSLSFVTVTVLSLVVLSSTVVLLIIHPESLLKRFWWVGEKTFKHMLVVGSSDDTVFSEFQKIYGDPGFSLSSEEKPLDESIRLLELELNNLKTMLRNLESKKKLVPVALKYKIGDTEKVLEKVKSGSLKVFEVTVKVNTKFIPHKKARGAYKKARKLAAEHY
ncbi:MAG: hypothetical protein JW778_05175 [Candidatus Altiarchaeota archaeon]|nr:hypothetical protein [Candidatus Altiarchaeota archaeon]